MSRAGAPRPAEFYRREADDVARDLLGDIVVSTLGGVRVAGRIVETEAYVGPHDEASHAAERIGRTARNDAMFGAPGIAYVYRIYGLHWCLNAVTGEAGYGAAVLIRALEPLDGIEQMRVRRPGRVDRDLARGPARLCEALGITGACNGHLLTEPPLIVHAGTPPAQIIAGPRIGITRAVDLPLRFTVAESRWVSR